jgi:hypothetical protein
MNTEFDRLVQWHQDEKAWWNMCGDYMTYQWRLTPYLHDVIRTPLEKDLVALAPLFSDPIAFLNEIDKTL